MILFILSCQYIWHFAYSKYDDIDTKNNGEKKKYRDSYEGGRTAMSFEVSSTQTSFYVYYHDSLRELSGIIYSI